MGKFNLQRGFKCRNLSSGIRYQQPVELFLTFHPSYNQNNKTSWWLSLPAQRTTFTEPSQPINIRKLCLEFSEKKENSSTNKRQRCYHVSVTFIGRSVHKQIFSWCKSEWCNWCMYIDLVQSWNFHTGVSRYTTVRTWTWSSKSKAEIELSGM